MDAVTVFLRPFPWEVESSLQILASLESMALAALIVWRFKSLRTALARSREAPFLMLCWVLTGLYAVSFASFANFGLLVRERSLVLPALFVLLSVDPIRRGCRICRRRARRSTGPNARSSRGSDLTKREESEAGSPRALNTISAEARRPFCRCVVPFRDP